jgi:hypothetical protein
MIKLTTLLLETIKKPKCIFVTGPAGSGKSYIVDKILPKSFELINIDTINNNHQVNKRSILNNDFYISISNAGFRGVAGSLSDEGLYYTLNGGKNWIQSETNKTGTFNCVAINSNGTKAIAGSGNSNEFTINPSNPLNTKLLWFGNANPSLSVQIRNNQGTFAGISAKQCTLRVNKGFPIARFDFYNDKLPSNSDANNLLSTQTNGVVLDYSRILCSRIPKAGVILLRSGKISFLNLFGFP